MRLSPFLLFLLVFISPDLNAQVCTGSLGQNIFTAGDFGSGSVNMPTSNPGIAPGYDYTTSPPPNDGFYTLTNDMSAPEWNALWDSWLRVEDNSPDPNGYMMVVNASFSPGIFYEQIVDDLCEQTTYEFTADIINLIRTGVAGHSDPNVSFLLDDVVQYETGFIPKDEKWNTYGFTFTTGPGQTSIKLSLRNNAPGGIGNDLALDNITFRPCGPDAIASSDLDGKICEDDQGELIISADFGDTSSTAVVQWQKRRVGEVWANIPGAMDQTYLVTERNSGVYEFRYIFAQSAANLSNVKCRTISQPVRIEVVPKTWEFTDTLCTGSTISFGDQTITTSGTYFDSLTSSIGCDSFVTLNVVELENIIPGTIGTEDPTCPGDSAGQIFFSRFEALREPYDLRINGQSLTFTDVIQPLTAGTYDVIIRDRFGCVRTESLDINDPTGLQLTGVQNYNAVFGDLIPLNFQLNRPPQSFAWNPTAALSCDTCLNPTVQAFTTIQYILELTDESDCRYTFPFNIVVDDQRPVYIPNAFSPNDDGLNDVFGVLSKPGIIASIDRFQVYNRWGGVVFGLSKGSRVGTDFTWDGRNRNGDLVNPGTYLYVIDIRFIDDQVISYDGSINVIK